MKVYRCSRKVKIRYALFGIFILALMTYSVANGITLYKMAINRFLFVLLGYALGIFYLIRGYTARLELREDEVYFWDGLMEFRHIKYDDIMLIEYHPSIRIRFYINNQRHTEISIANVFTKEDAKEILEKIAKKRKRIRISYLDDLKEFYRKMRKIKKSAKEERKKK